MRLFDKTPFASRFLTTLLFLVCTVQSVFAVNVPQGPRKMRYKVEFGDTVYLSEIPPAYVYARGRGKKSQSWRKYYKLVYNFAKVYPYALAAKDIVEEVDSTIRVRHLKYVSKDKYVNAVIKDLFNAYEKPLTGMTVTQGQLLMKLIDRECDISPYDIIKQFKNGYAAVFWQGVAKLFGNNLKKRYDPDGDDKNLEILVEKWEDGSFKRLYFDIFGEYPKNTELKDTEKKSSDKKSAKKKNADQKSSGKRKADREDGAVKKVDGKKKR